MAANKITFFACDNGDTSLIEAHGKTILTDINYRQEAANDKNEDVIDFAPYIRKACNNDYLDVFVLTHPDEDHLGGFGEVFHLGKPEDRDDDPDEGPVKVIVDEIWCSPYGANPNYTTEKSKPLLDEIARRKKLQGTTFGKKDGNRLTILAASDAALKTFDTGIEYRVLAPTAEEADIPKAKEGEQQNSANPSSLVLQWIVTVGDRKSQVLLCGDSTVDIWERIYDDYDADMLSWHILMAPHHCSRLSMGRKYIEDNVEKFTWSDNAINALDHPIGRNPHVVSSSRKFGSKHPPHPHARDQYYNILSCGNKVDDTVRDRFKVTAGKKGEDAKDVVFNFTAKGPSLAKLAAPALAASTPASAGGGGYGRK